MCVSTCRLVKVRGQLRVSLLSSHKPCFETESLIGLQVTEYARLATRKPQGSCLQLSSTGISGVLYPAKFVCLLFAYSGN